MIKGALILTLLAFFSLMPSVLSTSMGEDDYASNFTTISGGGENASVSDICGPSTIDQFGYGITEYGDIENRMGLMHLLTNDPPIVYLESPANNSVNTTDRTPDFFFNVSDNDTGELNCYLWLDNGTAFTSGQNSSVLEGESTSITSTKTLVNDDYWWWINCSDGDTWNSSEKWNISINLPAITITVDNPKNQSYSSQEVDLNITVSREVESCWWNLDDGDNQSMSGSGTDWDAEMDTGGEGTFHLFVYCNDTFGDMGQNNTIWFTVTFMDLQITRIFFPDTLMAGENETVSVNTTVKIKETSVNIYQINTTDDVPWDFTAPSESGVEVYFKDYSEGTETEITTNATVNVTVLDQSGSLPTLIMVNITNISKTDAGGYMQVNDSILLIYTMISSQMDAGSYRLVYTNATVTDNQENEKSDYLLENITAFDVVLRGYKTITVPDRSNPQNFSVAIIFRALGGPTSEIYLSDYLPDGASVNDLNVTLWNNSLGARVQLENKSDYYIDLDNPLDDVLPGGENVDIYLYNFSYNFTNWDGSLYDNDTLKIIYNATVIGGGSWVLPTITAGYDPTYRKHIKTEMHSEVNIPLFDVELTLITKLLNPGDTVIALLKVLNIGGPKAMVDVATTYSARTMQGDVITESTDTFAVTKEKEKELSLELPSDIEPGRYNFEALVTYTGREAISARSFEVVGAGIEFPVGGNLLYIIITIVAVLSLLYFRLGRHR